MNAKLKPSFNAVTLFLVGLFIVGSFLIGLATDKKTNAQNKTRTVPDRNRVNRRVEALYSVIYT